MKLALLVLAASMIGSSFWPALAQQAAAQQANAQEASAPQLPVPQLNTPPSSTPQRSLSLEEALNLAEGESEVVGIARADMMRATGERRRARAGYLPQLSGTAMYVRTLQSQFSVLQSDDDGSAPVEPARGCARFQPSPALPIGERIDSLESAVACASAANPFAQFRDLPFGRENEYRFGLSLSQNIFTGGRLSGQMQSTDANLRSAELGLTAARAQVLLDVTQAYYDAALADRLVIIAEATFLEADTTLTLARYARQIGNQSEFELLRAQVTRDNQRPIVIQRHADRELAYYRLKQLLNLPLDEPLTLATELGDTASIHMARLNELVQTPGDTAADQRAPVRQAAEGVELQQGLLRVARAQRFPQVTLGSQFAQLGYPADPSPFRANFVTDWTVNLGVQVPLWTGGRIGGDVQVAQAGVDQARYRLQQTRELAQLDARTAQTQLGAAHAGWLASVGTVEQAQRAYSIAQVRFTEGISTQTELLDSRIQLEQAQASRARAARDYQVAKMRLTLLPALPLGAGTAGAGVVAPVIVPNSPMPSQPMVPALPQQTTASGTFTGLPQAGAATR